MRFLTAALTTLALIGSTADAKKYRLDITGDNTFKVYLSKAFTSTAVEVKADTLAQGNTQDGAGQIIQEGWNTPARYTFDGLLEGDVISVYDWNESAGAYNGNTTPAGGNPAAIVGRLREVYDDGQVVPGGFDIPTDDKWQCVHRIERNPAKTGFDSSRFTGNAADWAAADFATGTSRPFIVEGAYEQSGTLAFGPAVKISPLAAANIWSGTNINGPPGVTAITGPLGANQGLSTPWWIYAINQQTSDALSHHGWCRFALPAECPVGQICPGGAPTTPPSGGNGDPVFSGFQGQEFQFHGLPDEHFNLVSSPQVQLNAHFVYLSSGKCDYNNTACWTHPGTYMDVLGFSIGEAQVKLVAGSHAEGLRLWVNDVVVPRHTTIKSLSGNVTASLHHSRDGRVRITTDLIDYEVINSDMFFNFNAAIKSAELLTTGAHKHTVTDSSICHTNSETHNHELIEATVAKKYPITTPLHGLVGQTWRNVKVCGRDWMGTVQDYVTESLFSTSYHYNYFKF